MMFKIMLVTCTLSQISGRECRDALPFDTMEHCGAAMAFLLRQQPSLVTTQPLSCEKRRRAGS